MKKHNMHGHTVRSVFSFPFSFPFLISVVFPLFREKTCHDCMIFNYLYAPLARNNLGDSWTFGWSVVLGLKAHSDSISGEREGGSLAVQWVERRPADLADLNSSPA